MSKLLKDGENTEMTAKKTTKKTTKSTTEPASVMSAVKTVAKSVAKTAAKATEKKAVSASSTAKKKMGVIDQEVYFQFAGQEIIAKSILDKAKKAFVAEGNKEADIKSIKLYIKPEENAAYYLVNNEVSSKKISLT